MPPPTVVNVGAVATGTTTITPAFPASIVANDILISICESTGGQNYTVPGSWAHIDTVSPVVQGVNTQLTVIWRRYDGVFTAPAIALPAGDHAIGRMIAIRGCPTAGNPWNVVAPGTEATSDTTAVWPAVTTTVADCLVLFIAATSADIATAQFAAMAGGTGLTNIVEQIDNATATGNGGVIGCITATKAAAGTTGAPTVTLTTAGFKSFMTLAMMPMGQRIQPMRRSFVPIDHSFRH